MIQIPRYIFQQHRHTPTIDYIKKRQKYISFDDPRRGNSSPYWQRPAVRSGTPPVRSAKSVPAPVIAASRATCIAVTRIGTFRAGPSHVTTIGLDGNALSLGSGGWSHL